MNRSHVVLQFPRSLREAWQPWVPAHVLTPRTTSARIHVPLRERAYWFLRRLLWGAASA